MSMQCPRCGLQNPVGITACARCGLPAPPPAAQPPPAVQPPPGVQLPPGQQAAPAPQASPYVPQSGPNLAAGYRPYSGYPATGYPAPGYPPPAAAAATTTGRVGVVTALGLAVLLCLAYAGWALTARRGIFADFADGSSVSLEDARSNDTFDTLLLVATGVVVVVALVWWTARLARGRGGAGTWNTAGLGASAVGLLVVVVGLVVSGTVTGAGDKAEQGHRGVTVTWFLGGGFLLLAVGLLLGTWAVLSASASTSHDPRDLAGYPGR